MRIGVRVGTDEVAAAAVLADGSRGPARTAPAEGGGHARLVGVLARALAGESEEPVSAVVVELSAALALVPASPVAAIRVTPREAPLAPAEMPSLRPWVTTFHVRGGHSALGRVLVPLDEEALAAIAREVEPGSMLAVTAAGSLGNPEHERRAGAIVRAAARLGGVIESSAFYADSFRVREQTAVSTAALQSGAEALALRIGDALGAAVPDARQFVVTNDGGCAPLSRLPMLSAHAMRSRGAAEMLGAAAVAGRQDGRIVLVDDAGARFADLAGGLLAARATTTLADGTRLASSSPHIVPVEDPLAWGALEPDAVVLAAGAAGREARSSVEPSIVVDGDLAAIAPLAAWCNRLAFVRSAAEIQDALDGGERFVRAGLVGAGADPGQVRIAESRVLSSTYGMQEVVRLRVRGVAPTPSAPMPGAEVAA